MTCPILPCQIVRSVEWDAASKVYRITCVYCGETFRSHTARRHYCGDRCFSLAHPCRPRLNLWTPMEDRTLRELAGELPVKAIAEKLGRTRAAVQRRAQNMGLGLVCYGERHASAKYTDQQVEEARSLHDQGMAVKAIAAQMNAPEGTVRDWVSYRWRLGAPIERYF